MTPIHLASPLALRLYRPLRNTQRALGGNRLASDAVGPVTQWIGTSDRIFVSAHEQSLRFFRHFGWANRGKQISPTFAEVA